MGFWGFGVLGFTKPMIPLEKTESIYKPPDFVTRLSGPVTLEENEKVF